MTSATSGPLLGAFVLAILVPVANWKGTAIGMILSHIITIYITFGHLMLNKEVKFLETSVAACTNETFSSGIAKPVSEMVFNLPHKYEISDWQKSSLLEMTTEQSSTSKDYEFPENIYAISYMYYSLIGTFITVVVGTIISYITRSQEDAYDSKLLHPLVYKIYAKLPGTSKYFLDQSDKKDIFSDVSMRSSPSGTYVSQYFESKSKSSINIIQINETINDDGNERYTKTGIGSSH